MVKTIKKNKYPQTVAASLDLHGFTIVEAEAEVNQFISEAKNKNWPIIRIITGQGFNSPDGRARLKPWLEDFLISKHYKFTSAKVSEGGEGAVDIRL